jgi:hypothetical protein
VFMIELGLSFGLSSAGTTVKSKTMARQVLV